MVKGRPAGYSSDEERSDDDMQFDFGSPTKKQRSIHNKVKETSLDQQLINAINSKDVERVKELIENGINVNFKCKTFADWSPIMLAASVGSREIIELLLIHGANPNDHHEMNSPIMCLCSSVHKDDDVLLECLSILIDHDANLFITDWYGASPLMMAVKNDHPKLVLKLLEMGVNLDQRDSDGWSAIFYAVDTANIHMVQLLKDAGANLRVEDSRGRTLYDIAMSKYLKDIAEIVRVKDTNFDIAEKIESTRVLKRLSHYEFMLSECPDIKKGRFFGFQSDALKLINGIGLGHLTSIFLENNIQLAHVLIWNDEDWKKAGVYMSFDRQTIKANIQRLHERHWSKHSLTNCTAESNLFNITQIICNLVRQFHIMSASIYFCLNHPNSNKISKDKLVYLEKGMKQFHYIKKEITLLHRLMRKIETEQCLVPADFIYPKKKNIFSKKLAFCTILLCLTAHKLNLFSYIPRLWFFASQARNHVQPI